MDTPWVLKGPDSDYVNVAIYFRRSGRDSDYGHCHILSTDVAVKTSSACCGVKKGVIQNCPLKQTSTSMKRRRTTMGLE